MTLFTRAEAQDFRALLGRCVSGRPRGPAPFLVVRFAGGKRTLASVTDGGVTLTHTATATASPDDLLVLPGDVLAEVEGGTDEVVLLERQAKLRGLLSLHDGEPRTVPVEMLLPGGQHDLPVLPKTSPVPASFLTALHECGRTAARDDGRFALSHVQVQGKAGLVAGTDGKVALLFRSIRLPFAESVLVPALPVFGSKPLARGEVRVGRTATHLVVAVGPWAVRLPVESKARYPDVVSLIPRQSPTVVAIEDQDVAELVKALPTLPGNADECRPVTLDADGTLAVRGRDETTGDMRELHLPRSAACGPTDRIALDRRYLARALSLGCRKVSLTPGKPAVFEGKDTAFVAVGLDPALVVPPANHPTPAAVVRAEPPDLPAPAPEPTERKPPMPVPESNGHTPPRGDPPDPLIAAEELRDALVEVASKTARLVLALRHARKERKVLSAVLTNLKQLNLTGDRP